LKYGPACAAPERKDIVSHDFRARIGSRNPLSQNPDPRGRMQAYRTGWNRPRFTLESPA
jgi:hypothetical protein